MKRDYRGFELSAERQESMGGDTLLYYYVMRKADGWFLVDSFTSGAESEYDQVMHLKHIVDDFFANPLPYVEETYTVDELIDELLLSMQPGQIGAVFKKIAQARKEGKKCQS